MILHNYCVFILQEHRIILTVYVDDFNIFRPDLDQINAFKTNISSAFKMTDVGLALWYLSMEIIRTNNSILLYQGAYARQIITKHGFDEATPTIVPLDRIQKLEAPQEDAAPKRECS